MERWAAGRRWGWGLWLWTALQTSMVPNPSRGENFSKYFSAASKYFYTLILRCQPQTCHISKPPPMSKNCKSMFQQHPDFQDWANRKPDNRTTVFTIDVPGSKTEACYPYTNPGKFGWCKTRSPVCRVVDSSCGSPLLLFA